MEILTDRQTDLQNDGQTYRPTDRLTKRWKYLSTDRQTYKTDGRTYRPTDILIKHRTDLQNDVNT